MPADNKASTRRWFEEVWNQGREAAIDEMLDVDVVAHGLTDDGQPGSGRDGFRRFYRQFRSGIPDVRIEVNEVIAEGDTTAVRITAHGTHAGDGFGVKATNRPVRVTGICMMRWRDGRIIEGWNEFDATGLMQQITAPAADQNIKVKA